jgi:hypothetical protein
MAGFLLSTTGLSIELRSIIRRKRLTPTGPARQARCSTPPALVRVRAPLIQRTQPMAGFLLFFLPLPNPYNQLSLTLRPRRK